MEYSPHGLKDQEKAEELEALRPRYVEEGITIEIHWIWYRTMHSFAYWFLFLTKDTGLKGQSKMSTDLSHKINVSRKENIHAHHLLETQMTNRRACLNHLKEDIRVVVLLRETSLQEKFRMDFNVHFPSSSKLSGTDFIILLLLPMCISISFLWFSTASASSSSDTINYTAFHPRELDFCCRHLLFQREIKRWKSWVFTVKVNLQLKSAASNIGNKGREIKSNLKLKNSRENAC